MGQRHQIYVVNKSKNKYQAIGAFHHQWCYGLTATVNLIRLSEATIKAKTDTHRLTPEFSQYRFSDPREVDTLVKAIYGVDSEGHVSMVHNEAEYLIDSDMVARPENGDNNDGAALIVIDNDKKEIRACLFTPGHVEGEHGGKVKKWHSYTPTEYLGFYYRGEKLAGMLLNNPTQATILSRADAVTPITQAEFREVFSKSISKRKLKAVV